MFCFKHSGLHRCGLRCEYSQRVPTTAAVVGVIQAGLHRCGHGCEHGQRVTVTVAAAGSTQVDLHMGVNMTAAVMAAAAIHVVVNVITLMGAF